MLVAGSKDEVNRDRVSDGDGAKHSSSERNRSEWFDRTVRPIRVSEHHQTWAFSADFQQGDGGGGDDDFDRQIQFRTCVQILRSRIPETLNQEQMTYLMDERMYSTVTIGAPHPTNLNLGVRSFNLRIPSFDPSERLDGFQRYV